jgi:hypothetical protein
MNNLSLRMPAKIGSLVLLLKSYNVTLNCDNRVNVRTNNNQYSTSSFESGLIPVCRKAYPAVPAKSYEAYYAIAIDCDIMEQNF